MDLRPRLKRPFHKLTHQPYRICRVIPPLIRRFLLHKVRHCKKSAIQIVSSFRLGLQFWGEYLANLPTTAFLKTRYHRTSSVNTGFPCSSGPLPVLPADKRKRRTYPVKCTEDNINRKWLPVSNADKDSGVKFPHQFCMGLLTFFIPFCHIYRVRPHNGNGNLLRTRGSNLLCLLFPGIAPPASIRIPFFQTLYIFISRALLIISNRHSSVRRRLQS